MPSWTVRALTLAGVVLVLYGVSCGLLAVLAQRLPPGLIRDVAEFLPACVTTARRLAGAAGPAPPPAGPVSGLS